MTCQCPECGWIYDPMTWGITTEVSHEVPPHNYPPCKGIGARIEPPAKLKRQENVTDQQLDYIAKIIGNGVAARNPEAYHYLELGFTVISGEITHRCTDEDTPLVIGYRVYEIVSGSSDGDISWQQDGAMSHPKGTSDITLAELSFECSVKWDACSNWTFGSYHWCGSNDAKKFIGIIEAIYDLARGDLPGFEGNDD